METLSGVNTFVYSEADDEILQVQREFIRSPEGLIQLPLNATASDILETYPTKLDSWTVHAAFGVRRTS